ncbi:IS1634 family transposase [Streptomyces sp. TM32]|uniref:IS1634 family transposase n=1 Tax=Streptomyces sp. TM32 TaxID=1652669 RepID=UPI0013873E8E|nr:IS1634 family transposase [Streptomyces sp. TM32]
MQLAHNRRVGGTTQAEVVYNFGREDRLDTDGLRRLVTSINRYLGEDGADPSAPVAGGGLEVTGSRPIGAVWLLQGLWRQLEIDRALAKILGERRFRTDVERVLFALVANRAIAPASKLSAAEWAGRDAAIPGLEAMDEDQAYRAMDLLVEADAQAEIQETVFFAVANLLNLEVDLIFFDTTNTYFECDEGDKPFRAYGKSKDHRDDLPQVTIGLAVTKEGVPVRCWVWPGGTSDQTILPQVKDDMRDWKLGRVITVVDRGFSSAENLAYLTRAGGHYIAGMRMRDGSDLAEAALARQGRYQTVRDNLRVGRPRSRTGARGNRTATRGSWTGTASSRKTGTTGPPCTRVGFATLVLHRRPCSHALTRPRSPDQVSRSTRTVLMIDRDTASQLAV